MAPASFHQSFSDFDSFEAAAQGWNLDFLQLDSGDFHASLSQLKTTGVVISRITLGRRILQRGETPPNFRTFGILMEGALPIRWRGHEVDPEHLMIFPHGHSLESITPPGFDAFAISISDSLLDQAARTRGLNGRDSILPTADLLILPETTITTLRSVAHKLLDQSIREPRDLATPAFLKKVDQEFVSTLLNSIETGSVVESKWSDSPSRSRGFTKALDLMKERADQAISISEVQNHAGVSERTLRYAFHDVYGMSPKSYLLHLRLNRFRLELIRNPERQIGRLAKKWGFWHMGQLSKDYQNLFGELPSQTNRNSNESSADQIREPS